MLTAGSDVGKRWQSGRPESFVRCNESNHKPWPNEGTW